MHKTKNVKATKLMCDDHIKVGGVMYRITMLNLRFGRGSKRVMIHMHTIDNKKRSYSNFSTPASSRFTIYNQ